MRNRIQDGRIIDVDATADVASGDLVVVGDLVCVASTDATDGTTFAGHLVGVFEVPKATGAVTAGAKLYLPTGSKIVTTTATNNQFAGHAIADAANSDASVYMRLSNG